VALDESPATDDFHLAGVGILEKFN